MTHSIRFPLILSIGLFAASLLVIRFSILGPKEIPFRLGESILRYGEEMDKKESPRSFPQIQDYREKGIL